jgi:hypothetical protein
MSETSPSPHDDWVRRVLDVALPASRPAAGIEDFRRDWRDAVGIWQDAIDSVDGQMARFAGALRGTGDPWLERIADFGLNAVTGNHKVRLMAALLDVGAADRQGLAARIAAARKAIGAFASHLGTSEKVAACDGNTLGVPVSIRATLGPALKKLADAMARAPVAG